MGGSSYCTTRPSGSTSHLAKFQGTFFAVPEVSQSAPSPTFGGIEERRVPPEIVENRVRVFAIDLHFLEHWELAALALPNESLNLLV